MLEFAIIFVFAALICCTDQVSQHGEPVLVFIDV